MRKRYTFTIVFLFILFMLSACSKEGGGSNQPEQQEINRSLLQNIQAPLEELLETIDEIEDEVLDETTSEKDAVHKHATEVNAFIEEKREYIENYPEPITDEGKHYFNTVVSGYEITFEALAIADDFFEKRITNTFEDEDIDEIEALYEPLEIKLEEVIEQLEKTHEQVFVEHDIDLDTIYFLE